MTGAGRERGSAVLAAVLASACFALLAAQAARTSRSEIRSANAGLEHARLAADADAGVALAIDNLTADPSVRWSLDREPHLVDFADADLSITVEDERGKVPLNTVSEKQVRALFTQAGADPAMVDDLVEAFLDWRDPNRQRPATTVPGSLLAPTRPPGPVHPAGGFLTIAELATLPGMTPELYAAVASSVSVSAGDTAFEPRTATPLALAVMTDESAGSVQVLERQRELSGERTALDVQPPLSIVGRAVTIRVEARDHQGGRAEEAEIVELTGLPDRPYVVRQRLD